MELNKKKIVEKLQKVLAKNRKKTIIGMWDFRKLLFSNWGGRQDILGDAGKRTTEYYGGGFTMSEVSIPKIRKSVRAHTGSEVKVRAVNGEEKVEIARGVISETYPSVFVIATDK